MIKHTQEIFSLITSPLTKEKVKAAFDSNKEITALNSNISEYYHFRLLRVNQDTMNLEFEVMSKFGVTYEVMAQFKSDDRIYLPHRFSDNNTNRSISEDDSSKSIISLSVLDNALIAAHSIESILIVQFAQDANEKINGLDMEFYKVEEGMVNIYASDKYGLDPNKAVAIGTSINGKVAINPASAYDREFRRLVDLKLLSSLKFI